MKKLKQIVVAVLLVYLFGVQIASAITVGNGNVLAEAPVYTFYVGETELGYGNIAKGNTLFPDGTWETFESGSFPLMAKITNANGALGGIFVIKYDVTKVTPLTYQTGRPGSWVDATEGKKVWYASEFSGEIGASSTTSGVYVDGLYGYVYANWIASSGAIDAEQFIEEGCNPELGCFVFRTNDGVTIEDFDAETFTVVASTLPEGAIKEGLASNGSPLTCNVKTAEGNIAYGISDKIQRLPMTVAFSYPNSNVIGTTTETNVLNPMNPVQNQELTVYAPQENVSETQQSITQTGTVQTDVALIYNQKYYENVLLPGQILSVPITITNESGTAKEIVSYVSKYSLTGQLTEVAQLGMLTVPPNETLTTTLTHTFSTETTCTAKILFWESDTLKPIMREIYYNITKELNGFISEPTVADVITYIPSVSGEYVFSTSAEMCLTGTIYNEQHEILSNGILYGGQYYIKQYLTAGETYLLETESNTIGAYCIRVSLQGNGETVAVIGNTIRYEMPCNDDESINVKLFDDNGNELQTIICTEQDNKISATFTVGSIDTNYVILAFDNTYIISKKELRVASVSKTYNISKDSFISIPTVVNDAAHIEDVSFSIAFDGDMLNLYDACELTEDINCEEEAIVSKDVNVEKIENDAIIFKSSRLQDGTINIVKLQGIATGSTIVHTTAYKVR